MWKYYCWSHFIQNIDVNPLRIRFDKLDGFMIEVYDRIRYLVIFGPEKYGAIYIL